MHWNTVAYCYLCVGIGWAFGDIRLMHSSILAGDTKWRNVFLHVLIVSLIWPWIFVQQVKTNRRISAKVKAATEARAAALEATDNDDARPARPDTLPRTKRRRTNGDTESRNRPN